MFLYWGRRGLSRLVLDIARDAASMPALDASICISRQNESFAAFAGLGPKLVAIDTFETNLGSLGQAWRIPQLRRRLSREVTERGIGAVIELMPHVWSSFIMPALKDRGVRYATVIHDAETHPGDYRSLAIAGLISRSIAQADVVLTLSESVADRLVAGGSAPRSKLITLFHPDLDYGGSCPRTAPQAGEPLRLAFMGRIMPYKGLPLFLDTIELLRAEGIPVEAGVFGEGALGESAARLEAMGAEVVNRWLTEEEIGAILPRYHALVLSHIEASQSGVAAAAFGAGLPVVATPVGGLVEQIHDGVNGMLAESVGADALARAVKRLLLDAEVYRAACQAISQSKGERSTACLVEKCVDHVLRAKVRPV